MLEWILLLCFVAALFLCVFTDCSILYAMVLGFLLFSAYACHKGNSPARVLGMAVSGIYTVRYILLNFLLIGIITAFWRAGGTIPFLVYYSAQLCTPSVVLLLCFWLCSFVSALMGTAFGTVATMGVICMTMANSLEIPPWLSGGAILSGIYFGDRCSPMSTSALLISALTGTNLYRNLRNMMRTSILPFVLASIAYFASGWHYASGQENFGMLEIFLRHFQLHPLVSVPAALILLLSFLRMDVKRMMAWSILASMALAWYFQGVPAGDLWEIALWGYHPRDEELSRLMQGGGIVSMVNVFAIVCLSSSYAGIFQETGFLSRIQAQVVSLCRRLTPFGGILLTSVPASMVSCNQTLAILLTYQLCRKEAQDAERFALQLEDTAVIVPALIPWSTAAAVPLSAISAPEASLLAAAYIYLLPLCHFFDKARGNGIQSPRMFQDRNTYFPNSQSKA